MKHINKDDGFSIVSILIVLVVISLIGASGWYVWQRNKSADSARISDKTSTVSDENDTEQADNQEWEEYKNEDYGFTFKYPSDWEFSEELTDQGRGGLEGEVTVVSPNSTEVSFNANFGGRGGLCEAKPTDKPHDTDVCSTIEILKAETVQDKVGDTDAPTVLYQYKYTGGSDMPAPKTEYGVFLDNGAANLLKIGEPVIGAWNNTGSVNRPYGVIDTHAKGGDIHNPDWFNSVNGKEATEVLKTFRLF